MARKTVRTLISTLPAAVGALLLHAGCALAQEATGEWHGTITTPAAQLRVGVTLSQGADGAVQGRLSSPDQGPGTVPLTTGSVEGGRLTFTVDPLRGRYEGRWDTDRQAWVGQWTQVAPYPADLGEGTGSAATSAADAPGALPL